MKNKIKRVLAGILGHTTAGPKLAEKKLPTDTDTPGPKRPPPPEINEGPEPNKGDEVQTDSGRETDDRKIDRGVDFRYDRWWKKFIGD